jgi:hypothetical protein
MSTDWLTQQHDVITKVTLSDFNGVINNPCVIKKPNNILFNKRTRIAISALHCGNEKERESKVHCGKSSKLTIGCTKNRMNSDWPKENHTNFV